MISALLYRLATGAYFSMIRVFALFNAKAALFVNGRKDLLRTMRAELSTGQRPRIWMHCASLGEFEQGRPVLEALRAKYPDHAFVLTFFSPSGYEVRKDYAGADHIFYLPVDTPGNAREFLDIVQPALCLFIKYELWYFYLSALAKRKVPSLLVSAIFSPRQGFFKWYGGLQRKMLGTFGHIFVQDNNSMELLAQIGITNVTVSGDTRFDRVIKAVAQVSESPVAAEFCRNHKVIVAGSTWKEDELLLREALATLEKNWKMILVPHEVHEGHLKEIEQLYGEDVVRWSDWQPGCSKRVLLVDQVGFLLQLYRYATVAWIGGAFGKAGVHNVLEAAAFGKPCFYGPVFHQFLEAQELVNKGGAIVVQHAGELVVRLHGKAPETFHKQSIAAVNYVMANGGATEVVMKYLAKQLDK